MRPLVFNTTSTKLNYLKDIITQIFLLSFDIKKI